MIDEVLGKSLTDFMHPEDAPRVKQWLTTEIIEDCDTCDMDHWADFQFRMTDLKGNQRWFISNSSVIRDDEGKVREIVGVAHDVTEMMQVHKDLEESHRHLQER